MSLGHGHTIRALPGVIKIDGIIVWFYVESAVSVGRGHGAEKVRGVLTGLQDLARVQIEGVVGIHLNSFILASYEFGSVLGNYMTEIL